MERTDRALGIRSLPDEITRSRLIDALEARWTVPIVVVEAPGGYGKSTAVAQAMRSNLEDPLGLDVYVACGRVHRDAESFTRAVLDALGDAPEPASADPDALAMGVLDRIARASPATVALILDDLHHLRADDSASEVLHAIVRQLPANARLVLVGRSIPKLPLTRFVASDGLLRLGAAELAFTSAEVAALAAAHRVDPAQLRPADGWPALTRLAITAGAVAPVDYLLEEIVTGLTSGERRAVAAILVARRDRVDWVQTLAPGIDLHGLVLRVPLLARHADDTISAHDLWYDVLDKLVDAPTRAELATAVARRAMASERFDEAVDVSTAHGAWDVALNAVLGFVAGGEAFPNHPRAVLLRDRFPDSLRSAPELVLLDGMIDRISDAPGGGAEAAEQALAAFLERGDIHRIAPAAFEVGYGAWLRGDLPRVLDMYNLAVEWRRQGHSFLTPVTLMVDSAVADLRGDARTAALRLQEVDLTALPRPLATYVLRELISKLQILGETREAVSYCEMLQRSATDSRVDFTVALAHWLDGDPSFAIADWSRLRHRQIGQNQTDFLTSIYSAHIDAALGIETPPSLIASFATDRSRERTFRVLALAAASVAAGDDAGAAQLIDDLLDELGTDPLCIGELRRQLALVYVLSPRARAILDRVELGPTQQRRCATARLLLGARLGEPVDWSLLGDAGDLLTAMPLRWSVELLARGEEHLQQAAELAEELDAATDGRAGRLLAELAADPTASVPGAAPLVRHLSQARHRVHLTVCGPLTVQRASLDGADDIRPHSVTRGRVRQLLGVLLLRDKVRVDDLLKALWPSMPEQQARNNLAVSLSLARDLIDPPGGTRRSLSLVERDDQTIRLRRTGALTSDLWSIQQSLRDAASRQRRADVVGSMRAVNAAVSLWTAPILTDLDDVDPFNLDVTSIGFQLAQRACDLAEWQVARGEYAEAERVARRVLEHDPFEERAHAVLVRSLVEIGTDEACRDAVAACRLALAELGASPGPALAMILRGARLSSLV